MAHQQTQETELNIRRAAARDAAQAFIGSIEAFMSEGQGAALTEKPAQHRRRVWLRWPDFWASAKRPNSEKALNAKTSISQNVLVTRICRRTIASAGLYWVRAAIRRNEFKL